MHPLLSNYFNFIARFLPSEPKQSAIGLDVGTNECKMVELMKKDNGYELVSLGVESIKSGDVATTVKKLLEKLQNPSKSVYTSVCGKGTLIRYIALPKMSLDDLNRSFGVEADKYFPFAQDQIYTDCFIIEGEDKGNQMSVMSAAVKKNLVDERIQLLNDLGLSADFVGINPVALANVIHTLGVKDGLDESNATALFDMGESVSNLSIIVKKTPRFTRDIFIGGRDLTKSIANTLGLSIQEADKLKKDPGKQLKEVIDASEAAIMNIVQELRLSFDYFVTEKNIEISKLLLTGGGSMLEGLADVFEKNLEIPVTSWNPIESLVIASNLDEEEVKKISFKMGVAVGLALYQYD